MENLIFVAQWIISFGLVGSGIQCVLKSKKIWHVVMGAISVAMGLWLVFVTGVSSMSTTTMLLLFALILRNVGRSEE